MWPAERDVATRTVVVRNDDNLHVSPSKTLYPRPQGLAGYLERMPQLRPALAQARASIRSEHSLKACLPPQLADVVHAIHSSGSAVVIVVTSAEAAHMVRLLRPELTAAFAAKGLKFNEILVNVQTKMAARETPRLRPQRKALERMSTDIERVKSERLQTSLERLVKTLSK
jgi:Dna[CI] antecedent, DciA